MSNSLLQFLSSEDVSNTLLYWISCFPFKSCQEVGKLTDLRDTVALTEILVNIDESYFKDLKVSKQAIDKNLWLVNLVQLKKLFLKLSAYVELYLKQDWSLLPVPDFKLVSRSEEGTSHLNFMVAAVLLTATHSGKNLEYQKILEFSIPSSIRRDIQTIQDSFLMALEPKSPKSQNNSPRKTSINTTAAINTLDITPRVLFPTTLSIVNDMVGAEEDVEDVTIEGDDIILQEIKELSIVEEPQKQVTCTLIPHDITPRDDSELIDLQNEIQIVQIRLAEMEKVLQKSKENEATQAETLQTLSETRKRFKETFQELQDFKEQREYEKIERNSLMAAFDQEKQVLDDQIESLKQELYTRSVIEAAEDKVQVNNDAELEQCKLDNTKMVNALKKARDHIIKQDKLIKDLSTDLSTLKSSFEQERIAMNRVLVDLGSKIQEKTL